MHLVIAFVNLLISPATPALKPNESFKRFIARKVVSTPRMAGLMPLEENQDLPQNAGFCTQLPRYHPMKQASPESLSISMWLEPTVAHSGLGALQRLAADKLPVNCHSQSLDQRIVQTEFPFF